MKVQYLVEKCCMSWGTQLYEDGVFYQLWTSSSHCWLLLKT